MTASLLRERLVGASGNGDGGGMFGQLLRSLVVPRDVE